MAASFPAAGAASRPDAVVVGAGLIGAAAVLGLAGWPLALCFAAGVALPAWALFNESGTTCSGRRGPRVPWMRARRGRVARSVRAHRPAAPTRTRPTKLGALSDRRDLRLFLR